MPKSKTAQISRAVEEKQLFDTTLSAGYHVLVVQKMPSVVTKKLPQTTCHFGFHCDQKGQPKPGTYRFSVELRDRAMSTAYPIESQGIRSLSKVLQSPTLMGQGKGGEEWMCITCYEGLLDNRLYSIHKVERPKLPRLLTWLDYIVPEIRSLPNFPSMITLTSPQRHTVYLWIAVHRWIVYLCKNPKVKEELDKEVYVEKAFRGSGLFPALNSGKALYLDVATRDYKGCAPSGSLAELNWSQVLEQNLSEFLALSDDLVELREREALGTSSEDSEGSQEEWLDEEESRHNEEDEDEDDGGASTSESTEASPEEEPEAARHPGDRHSDTPSTNPGLETAL